MEIETIEQLNERISRHWVFGKRTDIDASSYDPKGHAESWFFILKVSRIISADYSRMYDENVVAECEIATEIYDRDNYHAVFQPYIWSGNCTSLILRLQVNPLDVRTYDDMMDLYMERRADAIKSFDNVMIALRKCEFIPKL